MGAAGAAKKPKAPSSVPAAVTAVSSAPALSSAAVAVEAPRNIYGVMAPKGKDTPQSAIDAAKAAGAMYLRPQEVSVSEWIRTKGKCAECFKLRNCGLALVLTLRNGSGSGASTPPKDLGAYQKAVGEILENYRPALIAVENEENLAASYSDGSASGVWDNPNDSVDTAREYARQLNVACEEAQKRNMKCANGGLTSDTAAILTWFQYMSLGQNDKACSYAKRALGDEKFCKIKTPAQVPDKPRKQIELGRKLLTVYKNSPADYVNFHWYLQDAAALGETADFLQQVTGKRAISNEMGQRAGEDSSKNAASVLAAARQKNFDFAVWNGAAQAKEIRKLLAPPAADVPPKP